MTRAQVVHYDIKSSNCLLDCQNKHLVRDTGSSDSLLAQARVSLKSVLAAGLSTLCAARVCFSVRAPLAQMMAGTIRQHTCNGFACA